MCSYWVNSIWSIKPSGVRVYYRSQSPLVSVPAGDVLAKVVVLFIIYMYEVHVFSACRCTTTRRMVLFNVVRAGVGRVCRLAPTTVVDVVSVPLSWFPRQSSPWSQDEHGKSDLLCFAFVVFPRESVSHPVHTALRQRFLFILFFLFLPFWSCFFPWSFLFTLLLLLRSITIVELFFLVLFFFFFSYGFCFLKKLYFAHTWIKHPMNISLFTGSRVASH